jgi:hypothetical protein
LQRTAQGQYLNRAGERADQCRPSIEYEAEAVDPAIAEMSPNDASGSSEIITASWYALTTQIRSAGLELRSLAIRGSDVDKRGVEARQRDPDHQGQDRPVALRDRQTVFGGIHVEMSARRVQGVKMALRLSLCRHAVPEQAPQPTH